MSLDELFSLLQARKTADPEDSYTARLYQKGPIAIARKVAEEADEVLIEAVREDKERLVSESADLLYHLLVLWAAMDVTPADVDEILKKRAAGK